jgi:hypothetical protein
MPFIYIDRDRWQKLKQLLPNPTRRSLRERALWAVDHDILLTVDDIEMDKQLVEEQRQTRKRTHD